MKPPIAGISSKATAALLADLAQRYRDLNSIQVTIESVGGVDAARRVRDGEPFDVVVLDVAAIDALVDAACVIEGSRTDIVRSRVVAAVRKGDRIPDIGTVDDLRRTLLAARSIGFSTGPSGLALKALIQEWGMSAQLDDKLRQSPPGVPVGTLIESGDAEIGFQQCSELMGAPGVVILGSLPRGAEIVSTFSAGICARAGDQDAARRFIEFLASTDVADDKRRHGFDPA
jgi:molybdate transport system substrate-binding protein